MTEKKKGRTFSQVCRDDWKTPARRANEGRWLLSQIRVVLSGLEQLEIQYGTRIQKLAETLQVPTLESSGMKEAIDAFKRDLQLQGTLSLRFASLIREDILEPSLILAISNHEKVYADIENDALRQDEWMETVDFDYAGKVIECCSATHNALERSMDAQKSLFAPAKPKTEAFSRALNSIQDYELAQSDLDEQQKRMTMARQERRTKLEGIFKALEDMDRKRIACLKDSLLKTFVHRASQGRQLEYNLKSTIQMVEKLCPDQEIDQFLDTCYGGDSTPPPEEIDSGPEGWLQREAILPAQREVYRQYYAKVTQKPSPGDSIVNPVLEFFKKSPAIDELLRQAKATISPQLPNKKPLPLESDAGGPTSNLQLNQTLKDSLDQLKTLYPTSTGLHPCSISNESSKYEQVIKGFLYGSKEKLFTSHRAIDTFLETFSSVNNRSAFCLILIKEVIGKPVVLPDERCYQALTFVLNSLLNWTEIQKDHWNTRLILMASNSISYHANTGPTGTKFEANDLLDLTTSSNSSQDDGPVKYLSTGVYQHQVWNKIDFWSDALMYGLSEDRQRSFFCQALQEADFTDAEREQIEQMFIEYNPCSATISRFADYMKSFGISPNQVLDLFQRMKIRFRLDSDYINQLTHSLIVDSATRGKTAT